MKNRLGQTLNQLYGVIISFILSILQQRIFMTNKSRISYQSHLYKKNISQTKAKQFNNSFMKSEKIKKEKRAKENQIGKEKQIFKFDRIKRLKYMQTVVKKLPSNSQYEIQNEVEYLRHISSLIPFMKDVRLEQIPFIISQVEFNKIVSQLVRQTQHKEIIIALLFQIVKGFQEYSKIIQSTLYDTLEFIIEFQYQKKQVFQIQRMTTIQIGKSIVANQAQCLIRQIVKWYVSNKGLREKYQQLINKIR